MRPKEAIAYCIGSRLASQHPLIKHCNHSAFLSWDVGIVLDLVSLFSIMNQLFYHKMAQPETNHAPE